MEEQEANVNLQQEPTEMLSSHAWSTAAAQSASSSCSKCGAESSIQPASPTYVYAIGQVQVRFPSPSIEKEVAQVMATSNTQNLTDSQALHAILTTPENRYLLRQLCWVMAIEGLETYVLQPRESMDYSLLAEALRPTPSVLDLDVVIGLRGPIAPPQMCNGLMIPVLIFDQMYSFDRDSLVKSIPRPEKSTPKEFAATADEVLSRVMQMADNAGATDEHRAVN